MRTTSSIHRWVLATAVAVVVCVPTMAHEGHHHNAMGTVRIIDSAQLQLETKDGKLETYVLTDTTTYKRGDTAAKREDVQVGVRAVVMYETKNGKNVAIEVRLAKSEHAGHDGQGSRVGASDKAIGPS